MKDTLQTVVLCLLSALVGVIAGLAYQKTVVPDNSAEFLNELSHCCGKSAEPLDQIVVIRHDPNLKGSAAFYYGSAGQDRPVLIAVYRNADTAKALSVEMITRANER